MEMCCAIVAPIFNTIFIMNKARAVTISLTLLRLMASLMFFQAGAVKLFGWFGGMPTGVPMTTLIYTAGVLEVVGGALLFFGLLARPVAFILSGEMAVAYFMAHFPQGFWPVQNHGEPAVLFCFIFLFFAAYGAGEWSLDAVVCKKKK